MKKNNKNIWLTNSCLAGGCLAGLLSTNIAMALPQGGVVAGGQVSISTAEKQMTVTQSTNRAIVNWQSFNIDSGDTVNFAQPSSSSVILNRIGDQNPSQIMGNLNANGQVMLVNPNGIMFGQNAKVDVAGLVASTADIGDDEFMQGNNLSFKQSVNKEAKIINDGTITVKDAGLVALIAPSVQNNGVISAKLGKVVLAGVETPTVDFYGDGLISFSAPTLASSEMGTEQASAIVDGVVNTTGIIEAQSITVEGGFVTLGGSISADGDNGGKISVSADTLSLAENITARGKNGKGGVINIKATGNTVETSSSYIDASGTTDGGRVRHVAGNGIITSGHYNALGLNGIGGNIDLSADVVVSLSAKFDASGKTGGGRIRIGGEYQGGKNLFSDELPNANIVSLNSGTQITARGTGQYANGGEVVIWSEQQTIAAGSIDVSPLLGGTGGNVEVSSADTLLFDANINTGAGGTLLLDPKNITIGTPSGGTTFNSVYSIIGNGYTGGNNVDVGALGASDNFGRGISLDDNRLAVGTYNDDGSGNAMGNSGAVYLFSFTDSAFGGGVLESIIGKGYTGGKNIDVSQLEASDNFGTGVSLDGNRLAVGVYADNGSGNVASDSGAVYLFSFTDSTFGGGALEATIGKGYTGGKNVDIASLEANDNFGSSVSLDGNRLAVGAYWGDGSGNVAGDSGAAYLFSFTDSTFGGGTLESTIGKGYTGGKNIDLAALEGADHFGRGISLDGNRLVVGASQDDGSGNAVSNSGAAYLFSFTDSTFGGGTLEATIGKGYTGGKNVDISTLEATDFFGYGVFLDGNRLAIGTPQDDGSGNVASNSGAVYLFSFTNSAFSGGALEATIGKGYTGGKNVDVTALAASDNFGRSVSLDGNGLAIGVQNDDGSTNAVGDSGAVYLFSEAVSSATDGASYSTNSGSSTTITSGTLTTLLNAGTAVILQASNDITVSEAITSNNAGGNGGALTMQAGRSILLNANITTDNGNLTLYGNETLASGVVDAQRDAGAASITMASGISINAGTGEVDIRLFDGAGKTNATAGDIALSDITAGTIFARNYNSSGDIVLNNGAVLTSSAAGTNTTLISARNFINNAGSGALDVGSGRALIYSTNPSSDTGGGLTYDFRRFSCNYGASCPSFPAAGNGFLYSYTPTLTATPNAVSLTYGDSIPNLTGYAYTLSGYLGSDAAADNITSSLNGATSYSSGSNVGSYNINYSSGTLASALGYGFSYANNATAITVNAAPTVIAPTVTADNQIPNIDTLPTSIVWSPNNIITAVIGNTPSGNQPISLKDYGDKTNVFYSPIAKSSPLYTISYELKQTLDTKEAQD